jgi:hypothetical protein
MVPLFLVHAQAVRDTKLLSFGADEEEEGEGGFTGRIHCVRSAVRCTALRVLIRRGPPSRLWCSFPSLS